MHIVFKLYRQLREMTHTANVDLLIRSVVLVDALGKLTVTKYFLFISVAISLSS